MLLAWLAPVFSLAFKTFSSATMAVVAVMRAAMTLTTAMFSRRMKFFFHSNFL